MTWSFKSILYFLTKFKELLQEKNCPRILRWLDVENNEVFDVDKFFKTLTDSVSLILYLYIFKTYFDRLVR